MNTGIEKVVDIEKIRELREHLLTGLVERDVAIRLALLASLAGEHMLMLGPPGTAKSLVARRLHLAFADSTYFERLLTRFTVPEELFGPLSIKGLEDDCYERLTDAYLPKASIAFLDEIFKANSAILNALLTLLNEREFDNGTKRLKTPLVAVIGASNEMPEGDELAALYDRFLLRLHVAPVSKSAFPALLGLRGDPVIEIPARLQLTTADLEEVRAAAERVEVPADVVSLLCDLRDWCSAEQIQVSDRRWRKILKLLQVSAITNGRLRVSIWDCWLLQHCLWEKPEGQEKIYSWYATRVGASAAMDPARLTLMVTSWERKLKEDQESRSQARNSEGRLLYEGLDGKPSTDVKGLAPAMRGKEPLYLAPASALENSHYSIKVITDRTNGGKGYTFDELSALYIKNNNNGKTAFTNWDERSSYISNKNNRLMENFNLIPLLEPTPHKCVHIEKSLDDIDRLKNEVEDYKNKLLKHIKSLEIEIISNLWVTSDFAGPASENLERTRETVEALLNRIKSLRKGFELLPREGSVRSLVDEKDRGELLDLNTKQIVFQDERPKVVRQS